MGTILPHSGGASPVVDPLPYTYNLLLGGARWRDALGRARDLQPAGSASEFGVDVLVIGDSTGAYGNVYECWPHFLKVLLQERFNRVGVTGGFGYMPLQVQNSSSNDWAILNYYTVTCSSASATQAAVYTDGALHTFYVTATIAGQTTIVLNGATNPQASGTLTKVSGTGDATITYSSFVKTNSWTVNYNDPNPAVGLFDANTNPQGVGNKIWRYFDPTTAAGVFQRQGFTEAQYVGIGGFGAPNFNTVYFDISASQNAPLFPPSNSISNAAGKYGEHWTIQTGFTATTPYSIQIASTSTDKTSANGVILYNGDYNEGVRLHNLSSVGSNSSQWYQAGSSDQFNANFDEFCTGSNGGARNCKLLIINTMLNDCGQTVANVSPATFKSNLQSIITHVTGLASRPCVGLVVQRPWDLTTSNPTQLALYLQYRAACFALADANPQTVFVVNPWVLLSDDAGVYQFVLSGVTTAPTAGAVYKDSAGHSFTCVGTNAGKTGSAMTGTTSPSSVSGTLAKQSGTGDATIAFTSFVPPSPNGYANYGINAPGGAMYNRGWYNDGTHSLGVGNAAEARILFSALSFGS